MATIQTRTNKAGRTTYRVGFYEDGRFQWLPALAHEAGAQRIKAIVEDPRQGPTVARRILEAQVDSAPGMPRSPSSSRGTSNTAGSAAPRAPWPGTRQRPRARSCPASASCPWT